MHEEVTVYWSLHDRKHVVFVGLLLLSYYFANIPDNSDISLEYSEIEALIEFQFLLEIIGHSHQ